jgi:hypothetical protein
LAFGVGIASACPCGHVDVDRYVHQGNVIINKDPNAPTTTHYGFVFRGQVYFPSSLMGIYQVRSDFSSLIYLLLLLLLLNLETHFIRRDKTWRDPT